MGSPAESDLLSCHEWLCSALGVTELPAYESDERAAAVLRDVVAVCMESERQSRAFCGDAVQRCVEYEAERSRLDSLHETMGVTRDKLTRETRGSLAALAQMTVALGLRQPDVGGLCSEVARLQLEVLTAEQQLAVEEEEVKRLSEGVAELLKDNDMLDQRLVSSAKQADKEAKQQKQRPEPRFLADKTLQYERQVRKLENTLKERGVDGCAFSHQAVCRRSEELAAAEEKLDGLLSELKRYGELPACPDLAQVKVTELEMQLEKLEEELDGKAKSLTS